MAEEEEVVVVVEVAVAVAARHLQPLALRVLRPQLVRKVLVDLPRLRRHHQVLRLTPQRVGAAAAGAAPAADAVAAAAAVRPPHRAAVHGRRAAEAGGHRATHTLE